MKDKLTYNQALNLIREYNVTSANDYKRLRTSTPEFKINLPSQPMVFYKDEWIGWDDFTGFHYKIAEVDIESLQNLALSLNLKTKEEWCLAINTHQIEAPVHINKIKGFKNWNDFFNKPRYLDFSELIKFTRSLKLKTQMDWRDWCKVNSRPQYVPFNLRKNYFNDYLKACPAKKPSFWRFIFIK